jgi:hypothetical protein
MKTQLTILLFLWTITTGAGIHSVSAQHRLQSKHNMLRAGDEIIKQQVEYKDPGRAGENVLWDFSRLSSVNDEYTLHYGTDNDTLITGMEHLTRYRYTLQNDSLLLWGFENQTTRLINPQPELLLKFPVHFAGKSSSYYYAHGKHGNRIELETMGYIETQADAFGTIALPNKDTLKHVLRTRTIKYIAETSQPISESYYQKESNPEFIPDDLILARLQTDSVIFAVETFRWYAKGYRYPVFETVRSWQQRTGEDGGHEFLHTAFFFPPQEHYYLDDDEENLALLEEDNQADPGNPHANPWSGLTYNFYPNPVEVNLEIEMYLPKPANRIRMQLTDRMGRVAWAKEYGSRQQGIHTEQIYMYPFVTGEYILNIWFDDYMIGEKIIKK